jgi:hypothetical protein
MKLLPELLVVTALLLTACGTPPSEGTAGAATPEQLRTTAQAYRGECYVSVQCEDGSTVSCHGVDDCRTGYNTISQAEFVRCGGYGVDCINPNTCTQYIGISCTKNSQCGTSGSCLENRCACVRVDY